MNTYALLHNAITGRANHLTVKAQSVGILRQGNGHFNVVVCTVFADGGRGIRDVAMNVRGLDAARTIAEAEAASLGCRVIVAPSALAA